MTQRNLKSILIDTLKTKHLLSVAEILKKLEAKGKTYNKTSVYRDLEQLVDEDVVCKHYFDDAQALYELRDDHHTHVFCRVCGKIAAAPCSYEQPKTVGEFEIDHHHLTLVGVCSSCKSA